MSNCQGASTWTDLGFRRVPVWQPFIYFLKSYDFSYTRLATSRKTKRRGVLFNGKRNEKNISSSIGAQTTPILNLRRNRIGKTQSTYNDGSNRVHPTIKRICEESSNESNNVGDNIKKVILGIRFDDLISERPTINNQPKFHQSHRKHNANKPSLLLHG